jgi:SAM-dependent methyltransferase
MRLSHDLIHALLLLRLIPSIAGWSMSSHSGTGNKRRIGQVSAASYHIDNNDNDDDDGNARSAFGTRHYWDDVYSGMGDFPMDEYSWYYGWSHIKGHWVEHVKDTSSQILCPGIGNDPLLVDLWKSGYHQLTAFDYSHYAIERQRDLISYASVKVDLHHLDARTLPPEWTQRFHAILEKGALDAIYLSGDGNVELAIQELERCIVPGGILLTVSGVIPPVLRRNLFSKWTWLRDGTDDLQAGCFVLQYNP